MPLTATIRSGETITIEGIRIVVDRTTTVRVLDQAEIVFPNGRVAWPKEKVA